MQKLLDKKTRCSCYTAWRVHPKITTELRWTAKYLEPKMSSLQLSLAEYIGHNENWKLWNTLSLWTFLKINGIYNHSWDWSVRTSKTGICITQWTLSAGAGTGPGAGAVIGVGAGAGARAEAGAGAGAGAGNEAIDLLRCWWSCGPVGLLSWRFGAGDY